MPAEAVIDDGGIVNTIPPVPSDVARPLSTMSRIIFCSRRDHIGVALVRVAGGGGRTGVQQVGRRLDRAGISAYVLLDALRMCLECLPGRGRLVVQRVVHHLLRGVGQLVGNRGSSPRLVERTDVVVQVDLAVAGERLGSHRVRLGRDGWSTVHEAVADVDAEHVAHRGAHIGGHDLGGRAALRALVTLAFGAHGFREGTVVGGSEPLSARVREAGPAGATRAGCPAGCRRRRIVERVSSSRHRLDIRWRRDPAARRVDGQELIDRRH